MDEGFCNRPVDYSKFLSFDFPLASKTANVSPWRLTLEKVGAAVSRRRWESAIGGWKVHIAKYSKSMSKALGNSIQGSRA
jgi:hypothetical protein